ncbi:MAG: (d)CMP kinase [Alphaproteobacteria bacterium]|nr:(d)CMP kinase [Alphaproteobacteria bacterium]
MIVAVDGPAASGKGTLARRLARHFGLNYLDTGSLYRAVALRALTAGADPADPAAAVAAARQVEVGDLDDLRLRDDKVAQAASVVAAIPGVRAALLAFQRDFARRGEGAVLDGRDIGTVVCPDADAKVFLTATVEARAMRRFKELQARSAAAIYERVLQDMKLRDARDRERHTAPLVRASDAFELDTTALDADAAFVAVLRFIGERRQRR